MRQVEVMNAARERQRIENATPRQFLMPDEIIELPRQAILIDHQCGTIVYGDFFKKRRSNSYVLSVNGKPIFESIGFARGVRELAKELQPMASPSRFY